MDPEMRTNFSESFFLADHENRGLKKVTVTFSRYSRFFREFGGFCGFYEIKWKEPNFWQSEILK